VSGITPHQFDFIARPQKQVVEIAPHGAQVSVPKDPTVNPHCAKALGSKKLGGLASTIGRL
jgi:hypothetical protein